MAAQTDQIGTFSGLSHVELVAAYQACRARNAKLEEALTKALVIIQGATHPGMPESPFMRDARAILAEVTP